MSEKGVLDADLNCNVILQCSLSLHIKIIQMWIIRSHSSFFMSVLSYTILTNTHIHNIQTGKVLQHDSAKQQPIIEYQLDSERIHYCMLVNRSATPQIVIGSDYATPDSRTLMSSLKPCFL